MENTNEYYLKEAPVKKALIKLSIPMMIGISIGTVYSVINTYFIGLLKNVDMLSSLMLSMPIFIILMAIGNMFGVGGGTYITRLIAKDEIKKAKKIATYTLYSSFIFSIVIGIICIILINPIVHLLGATGSTLIFTKRYAITCLVLGFAVVLNFTLEQIVRANGATKESMYGMGISALVNLIFDPILILVFHLDLVGAGIAMSLANLVSASYYIYYLNNKSEKLRNFFSFGGISLKDKIEIYKIGIPELIQMAFMIVTTLLLNNYCIEYGASAMAAMGIGLRVSQVPEFLNMGIFLGAMPILAYSFSIKDFKRFYSTIREGFKYIAIISLVSFILLYIFRADVIGLFSNNKEVIEQGKYILTVMLVALLFNGFTGFLLGIFQASGKGIPTTIIAVSQGVLSIPVIIIGHMFFGFDGVIWSAATTEFITFIMGVIMYVIVFYSEEVRVKS